MARAGLGAGWECLFANDFSTMKAATYSANWGDAHLRVADVAAVTTADLPGEADLVWASTPCQDLSLAGNAVGLGAPGASATRSGAFWPWWSLMTQLAKDGRKPRVIVIENVVGALSSNKGADFQVLAQAMAEAGYAFGAVVIDAKLFLPQSRPRLFIIGVSRDIAIAPVLRREGPQTPWHSAAVQAAFDRLPAITREAWIWWALPTPLVRRAELAAFIEDEPTGVSWHSPAATRALLAAMTPANTAKLKQAQTLGRRTVGTIYKRTRPDAAGVKHCRAEVRFDGVAGCLRTPSGGSSRQTVIVVEGRKIRTRLLSTREAARLMGLPDSYILPSNYNDAYHVCGDGVATPVVRFLAQHLLEKLVQARAEPLAIRA